MKWQRGYRSSDVIDNRGKSAGRFRGAGMLGPMVSLGSRFGIGGIVAAAAIYFGLQMFSGGDSPFSAKSEDPQSLEQAAPSDEAAQFVAFVFDDAQRVWTEEFKELGRNYERAKLVLFTGQTGSACGFNSAAVGPFYCPPDHRVYIDLGFYRDLEKRFGAPGDFAQAYVIGHEVGHHVQTLLGTQKRVSGAKRSGEDSQAVRLELQADCYAGIWAHSTERRELLEKGDIEEGLNAAAAIGDDRLQQQAGGTVQPESWTHGSSAQRSRWFRRGYDTGDFKACDTFSSEL